MSALRIKNCRLRREKHAKGRTFAAGNDDWSFHTHARGIHRPASGTRGNLRRGCAHGAAFPAQSAVRQGFLAPIVKESRLGICSHAGTRRPASCEARFAQRGLAKCLLSRLCRLHANARVCAEPRRIDPLGEPGANRLDVRRSGAVALSSFAHRRCLAGSWNPHRGHHECNSPSGSYSHALCQSPGHRDHISDRGFREHAKEAVGQTLPAAARREDHI